MNEARWAALSATRQMICDDSFNALTALLVDCGAVPRNVMAGALERLSGDLAAKAGGRAPSDCVIYPAEAMERAQELAHQAQALRAMGR
jgi:hypothetical protein